MDQLAPLLATLSDLVRWWEAEQVPGLIIGGVAASVLGRPRVTRDVDGLVWLEPNRWEAFLTAGAAFGFLPRLPDALDFALRARVLLLRHEPSGIDADIALGALPFEEVVLARAISVEVGGVALPLPSPEDLIVMKAVAGRARDLADIESVLDTQPAIDLAWIRRWARDFSEALDSPEVLDDLEALLARRRKGRH